MDRLIIESIEGRITLGIVMFVSLMILIGWIMINEPYRMAEFQEQHLGRSIEVGAELFASNCTSCHGTNGQGSGQGPALNNPHLFEYDFTAEVNGEIADLQRQIRDLYLLQQDLVERQQIVTEELGAEDISEERAAELSFELVLINAQLDENVEDVAAQLEALNATEGAAEDLTEEETEALATALENNIPTGIASRLELLEGEEGLLAERDAILEQLSGAIARGYYPDLEAEQNAVPARPTDTSDIDAQLDWIEGELELTNYIAADASRLQQVEWGGDLRGYLTTTLIHGRPGSNNVWPGPMVAWSQTGGGPLRRDQIDNIVNYIINWDKGDNWTMADLATVQQFARIHADASMVEVAGSGEAGITPVTDAVAALPEGNADNGASIYQTIGCAGCHNNGAVGPATAGTWARAESERLMEPEFEGWTVEEYIYSSITHPNDYVVDGYASGLMPANFSDLLTEQDIADVIAYLETQ